MFNFLIKPFLFLLHPEIAHKIGIFTARFIGWLYRFHMWIGIKSPQNLRVETPFGRLSNPVGLAAGFDKNAEALWGWEALGFGFVEVGTATPLAQDGNPRPRLFRFVKHRALVNKMGFNNVGALTIAENIRKAKSRGLKIKVGGNIGKNLITPLAHAAQDFKTAAIQLSEHVDYIVINVSSPNTPGLRALQSESQLDLILTEVRNAIGLSKPLFIKIAPDRHGEYLPGVTRLVEKHQLAGVICCNTLLNHASASNLSDRQIASLPDGGLSGQPIFEKNLQVVKDYRAAAPHLFIIGVGGIETGRQAQLYLESGARLVQSYSGFVFAGPKFVREIINHLKGKTR